MHKKNYKIVFPDKIKYKVSMNLINSMLIKLRYFSSRMQTYSRKSKIPNEMLYRKNLDEFLDVKKGLKKFDIEVIKIRG